MKRLLPIIEQFSGKKILVVGDVILDMYLLGDVSRISPEAPIPVVRVKEEKYVPGGASNTATNVVALGGLVTVVGLAGKDNDRAVLVRELQKRQIAFELFEDGRPTTKKTRVLGQNQQLVRVDYEDTKEINEKTEREIIDYLKRAMSQYDAVIISDYAKGVITEEIARTIIENAKIVVVDPRPQHKGFYQGATLITPNHKEASQMAALETNGGDVVNIGKKLVARLGSDVLITRGPKGISVFEKDGSIHDIPTKAREVYDVSGAGDTVAASVTLALTAGASLKDACEVANHAAGIVVGKLGTAAVSQDELKSSMSDESGKVKTKEEISRIADQLRKEGKTIVTTNGSFDLMHAGHVKFLREAKKQGDILVVGLNSDVSIKQYKGPDRPIVNEEMRANMLGAFEFVDYIVLYDETVPMPFIEAVRPDVHVNGEEYGKDCIEIPTLKKIGARLHLIQRFSDFSTTDLIRKVKKTDA